MSVKQATLAKSVLIRLTCNTCSRVATWKREIFEDGRDDPVDVGYFCESCAETHCLLDFPSDFDRLGPAERFREVRDI